MARWHAHDASCTTLRRIRPRWREIQVTPEPATKAQKQHSSSLQYCWPLRAIRHCASTACSLHCTMARASLRQRRLHLIGDACAASPLRAQRPSHPAASSVHVHKSCHWLPFPLGSRSCSRTTCRATRRTTRRTAARRTTRAHTCCGSTATATNATPASIASVARAMCHTMRRPDGVRRPSRRLRLRRTCHASSQPPWLGGRCRSAGCSGGGSGDEPASVRACHPALSGPLRPHPSRCRRDHDVCARNETPRDGGGGGSSVAGGGDDRRVFSI